MLMNVLLVRAAGRFVSLSFPDGPMVAPPRSLLHLARAVKEMPGVRCHVIDALAHPNLERLRGASPPFLFGLEPAEVVAQARAIDPQVIGLTTMATYFYRETQELVSALREAFPSAFIILGGPDPSCDWQRYLDEGPGIDAVAIGEGEATFAELIGCLREARSWHGVAGLAYREDGKVVLTPVRPYAQDLDPLMPDYSLIRLEDYFELAAQGFRSRITYHYPGVDRAVDLVTSRGCPYKCAFCSIQLHMGRRFRAQSPEAVLSHLGDLVGRGVRHVHFEDDIVNFDRDRWKAILRGLIERHWPLTWDTPNGLRADLLDRETIELCCAAGCAYLAFGVESGSARVLDEIVHKQLDLAQIEEAARQCQEVGLDTLAFYVVGFPGETLAEAEQTFRFAFDLYRRFGTTPILQVWRPYVGTDLHTQVTGPGGAGLQQVDPLAMHRQHGIPYTLFRDTVAHNDNLPLAVVADFFRRYQREGMRQSARYWLLKMAKNPRLAWLARREIARAGADVARHPSAWQGPVRRFFFETGLYANCVQRQLGQEAHGAQGEGQ